MKSVMAQLDRAPASDEDLNVDLELQCELWDWARAAGASADELRKAVLEALALGELI